MEFRVPEHRAYLAALPNVIFKAVAARAFQNGFVVEQTDTKMTVTAPLGQVVMVAIGTGIDLTLSADTPEKLQLFTDIYAQ